jgi:hypothetical protein
MLLGLLHYRNHDKYYDLENNYISCILFIVPVKLAVQINQYQ